MSVQIKLSDADAKLVADALQALTFISKNAKEAQMPFAVVNFFNKYGSSTAESLKRLHGAYATALTANSKGK